MGATTADVAGPTRDGRRLARLLFAVFVFEVGLALAFALLDLAQSDKGFSGDFAQGVALLATFVLFPVIGVLVASRQPGNALGWILLAVGLVVAFPTDPLGSYLLDTGHHLGAWFLAATEWTWVPMIGLSGVFLLLLFPDGHLPSPRWRWFAWAVGIGMVLASIGITFSPGNLADSGYPHVQNPYGIEAVRPLFAIALVGIAGVPIGIIGAAVSLVVRFRRSDPVGRLQIRWLASAALLVAIVYAITMVASVSDAAGWSSGGTLLSLLQTIAVALFGLLPISIGIAVLRYRLYDINVVIRKTVVVGALAVFFTIVYAAIVGGIGALVGAHSTSTLSFIAAAAVAALFHPALGRARRIADRLVYGRRATPYEVLSEFGQRLGETYAADDVVQRMARVLGEGVGARRARVWLFVDGGLRPVATWPDDADLDLPDDVTVDVRHRGEVLGALSVTMAPSDPIDPTRTALVEDLASQAGLVLRNVRLTEELRARLNDLRAAQKRLVSAQDHERRRLERNIHDGAQQQLVALAVKARLARSFAASDPDRAAELLDQMEGEMQAALEDLRDLARGIYPPLLADKGLGAALEAQVRKSPVPVSLDVDGVGRLPQDVEAAAYFSVLEALQNVAKYAGASHATVQLGRENGELMFTVADDGAGFDPKITREGTGLQGIGDRLRALDGVLEVSSAVGSGTKVTGRIPLGELSEQERIG